MKTLLRKFLLAACSIYLCSCASIINTGRQSVPIRSNPAGATIVINDSTYGKTPLTLNMKRKKKDRMLVLKMEGYVDYRIQMARTLSGWFFGNLIIGGGIGMIIDAATGCMYNIKPEIIDVNLQKIDGK